MTDDVILTAAELRILTWVGRQRRMNATNNNRDPGQGPTARDEQTAIDNHIRGAQCEFAASVVLNLYWRPYIGHIRERDVGGLIDTRSTVLPHGRLIVKPADPDHVPFVLVLAQAPRFTLLGWQLAVDAKRWPLLLDFGDPAHFVPQDSLRPLDELRTWIMLMVGEYREAAE